MTAGAQPAPAATPPVKKDAPVEWTDSQMFHLIHLRGLVREARFPGDGDVCEFIRMKKCPLTDPSDQGNWEDRVGDDGSKIKAKGCTRPTCRIEREPVKAPVETPEAS